MKVQHGDTLFRRSRNVAFLDPLLNNLSEIKSPNSLPYKKCSVTHAVMGVRKVEKPFFFYITNNNNKKSLLLLSDYLKEDSEYIYKG